MNSLSPDLKAKLLKFQRSERTEALVYMKIAKQCRDKENCKILLQIADDEIRHAEFWKKTVGGEFVGGDTFRANWWAFISRFFGVTFGLRLMESGEESAQKIYAGLSDSLPGVDSVIADEEAHEQKLIGLLNEKKMEYVGSIVLGLNDALVELTGALAGFSFALQNTRLIALLGAITGIAATLSMAASEYLSNRADDNSDALTSSIYTGIAYLITVILLVVPYFLFTNYIHALIMMLSTVVIIIAMFTFYLSVAKNQKFWHRFLEMTAISVGVAVLSFGIGVAARLWLGVDV
jgi:VIT1/CCC1 family predicted Fe2+/Mn2+ transporter